MSRDDGSPPPPPALAACYTEQPAPQPEALPSFLPQGLETQSTIPCSALSSAGPTWLGASSSPAWQQSGCPARGWDTQTHITEPMRHRRPLSDVCSAGFSLRRVLQVVELAVAERIQARGTGASLFSGLPSAVRVLPSVLRRQQCPLQLEGGVLRRRLILASKAFLCPKQTAGAQTCSSNRYPWLSWRQRTYCRNEAYAEDIKTL